MSNLKGLYEQLEYKQGEYDAAALHAKLTQEGIDELKAKIEQEEAKQEYLSTVLEAAEMLKGVHSAFVEAGFSEEQAFSLVRDLLCGATAQTAHTEEGSTVPLHILLSAVK